MVYSNTAVYMGGNEYGKSGHLSMFTALKHLMMLLKEQHFQYFIFIYTLSKTLITCRDMQLKFFKVETLLTLNLPKSQICTT